MEPPRSNLVCQIADLQVRTQQGHTRLAPDTVHMGVVGWTRSGLGGVGARANVYSVSRSFRIPTGLNPTETADDHVVS